MGTERVFGFRLRYAVRGIVSVSIQPTAIGDLCFSLQRKHNSGSCFVVALYADGARNPVA